MKSISSTGDPILSADRHVLFKHAIKEISAQRHQAVSFMPKISVKEPGNSCHIHISLWDGERNAFCRSDGSAASDTFRQFLGGLLKYTDDLPYFFAPTINAYKRDQPSSWAPTKLAWAIDNRTVGFRVVGRGDSYRIENRMSGADANPYLAYAATIAAGLAGIKEGLDCGDDVIEYLVHHARIEVQTFNQTVTDWELRRYFERI